MSKRFFTKHKVLSRIILYSVFFLIAAVLGTELALRYLLPLESVKANIEQRVSAALNNADVKIAGISAGLYGLDLQGLSVVSEKEDIAYVDHVTLRFSLPGLIRRSFKIKHILVDGLKLNIIKNKEGHFNFERLLSEEFVQESTVEKKQDRRAFIAFLIRTLQVESTDIVFIDQTQDLELKIDDLSIDISGFDMEKPFRVSSNNYFKLIYKDIKTPQVRTGITVYMHLAGGDLDNAYIQIKTAVLSYNGSSMALNGKLSNFNAPELNFQAHARKLVSYSFRDLAALPYFNLSSLKINGKIAADIPAQKINIEDFNINTAFSTLNTKGFVTPDKHDLRLLGQILLSEIHKAVPQAEEYKPQGTADFDFEIKDMDAKGFINITDVGGHLPDAGTLSAFNTKVEVASIKDINLPAIQGKLNGHTFYSKLKFLMRPEGGDIIAAFDAHRVYVHPTKAERKVIVKEIQDFENAPSEKSIKELQEEWNEKLNLPPFRIQTHVDIRSFDGPFFKAEHLKLSSDVSDVTIMLDKLRGYMHLSAASGQIKDIHELAQSNAITRVLFTSLCVVSKMINSLNIVGVLEGLVKVNKNEPEPDEDGVINPELEDHKLDGKMNFDTFATVLNFNKGRADIKKSYFVSEVLSFQVGGDMDFNTRDLDMTINAAPGKHVEGGIMPLTVKVKGTIDEPKGSMSVLGSIGRLFSQTLLNNAAVRAFKSGVLGVKDDTPEPAATK